MNIALSQLESQQGQFRSPPLSDDQQKKTLILLVVLILIAVLAQMNSLVALAGTWAMPQYSHGWLIPIVAVLLLYLRKMPFREVPTRERWVGVALIACGVGMRLFGALTVTFTLDNISLIPTLLGIFVLVGGLTTLRWAGLPLFFLVFMFPLPRFLYDGVTRPLQSLATTCSQFALETLGVECIQQGNQILLDKVPMNVADQCSGLRMLTIFVALAFAMALLLTNRPWWERFIIICSAVPIALAVNVIRITVTGILYNLNVPGDIVNIVFHDLAGWIMMPMALGLMYLEYQILNRLVVEDSQAAAPISLGTGFQPPVTYKSS